MNHFLVMILNKPHFFQIFVEKGISGSHTDFLIFAIASKRAWKIYSLDGDFENYSKVIDSVEIFTP